MFFLCNQWLGVFLTLCSKCSKLYFKHEQLSSRPVDNFQLSKSYPQGLPVMFSFVDVHGKSGPPPEPGVFKT